MFKFTWTWFTFKNCCIKEEILSAGKEVNLSEAYDNQLLELADAIISILLFYSWMDFSYFFTMLFQFSTWFHLVIKIQKS